MKAATRQGRAARRPPATVVPMRAVEAETRRQLRKLVKAARLLVTLVEQVGVPPHVARALEAWAAAAEGLEQPVEVEVTGARPR